MYNGPVPLPLAA